MKFTLSWLREHLDTDAPLDRIATTLSAIGIEVEGVHNPAAELASFRIARVIEAVQHPNAARLRALRAAPRAARARERGGAAPERRPAARAARRSRRRARIFRGLRRAERPHRHE